MIQWQKTCTDTQSILELSLRIGNLFAPNPLTEMEILIVAFMLRNYPEGTNFRETGIRKKVLQHFRFSKSGLSTHFSNLHKKEWLVRGRFDADVEKFRNIELPLTEIKVFLKYEHTTRKKRS